MSATLPIIGRVGTPIMAGTVVGLAAGFMGTDIISSTLDSLSASIKSNAWILGLTTGVLTAVAIGLVINMPAARALVQ